MSELFALWIFFPDGSHACVDDRLTAGAAVEVAKQITERPMAKIGLIHEIRIVDGDDLTVFQWQFGKGVIFPTPQQRARA